MGYFLPLKFFKVGPHCAVCATRVTVIMSTESFQAREAIKTEKRAKTLINAAGRNTVKAAIFLDNDTVVASPVGVTGLLNSIERANSRRAGKASRESENIKIYDTPMFEDMEGLEEDETGDTEGDDLDLGPDLADEDD